MKLSRDSALWTLGILGALITYLSNGPAPSHWTYPQLMQFLSFVVGVVSAALRTSPLNGSIDPNTVSLPKG